LCVLPDGRLLVLERGFAAGLHLRLFLADFQKATDTSRLPALDSANCIPAKKILLFEQPSGFINFEGIALGPKLSDGSRSLLIIADSNGGNTHHILPLKVRFAAGDVVTNGPAKAGKKMKDKAVGSGKAKN